MAMTKGEAQAEIKRLRRSISAKFGTYKLVPIDKGWGIQFTPKSKQKKSIYKG